MLNTFSPLRYPGGKGKTYKMIKSIIESNNLSDCIYIEPFAGGASLALRLLYEGIVQKIIINDYDKSIYAFWYAILNDTDRFCQKILETDISIYEWKKQKNIQAQKDKGIDLLDLGFSTFYLNRTNRSGILGAGPIGGYNQDGNYKMDCRYNKEELIKRIKKIKDFSKQIEVLNEDAAFLIRNKVSRIKRKCFLFIDPPYYNKGKELYMNFFNHSDHVDLEKNIRKLKKPYIITYDNEKAIKDIYVNYNITSYNITYTVEKKYVGNELIIYNDNYILISDEILNHN